MLDFQVFVHDERKYDVNKLLDNNQCKIKTENIVTITTNCMDIHNWDIWILYRNLKLDMYNMSIVLLLIVYLRKLLTMRIK